MTRRSRSREVALQLLFQREMNPAVDRAWIERFARDRLREPELVPFCLGLFDGITTNLAAIDAQLAAAAENWRLPRMAAVDRNVLRMGAYELLFTPDTPSSVALNEAIELARRYGSADSPAFVNGVLDRLKEARGQRTEDREQKTEDGGQRTEDRGQLAE
jgi:N utilization substance protein B